MRTVSENYGLYHVTIPVLSQGVINRHCFEVSAFSKYDAIGKAWEKMMSETSGSVVIVPQGHSVTVYKVVPV